VQPHSSLACGHAAGQRRPGSGGGRAWAQASVRGGELLQALQARELAAEGAGVRMVQARGVRVLQARPLRQREAPAAPSTLSRPPHAARPACARMPAGARAAVQAQVRTSAPRRGLAWSGANMAATRPLQHGRCPTGAAVRRTGALAAGAQRWRTRRSAARTVPWRRCRARGQCRRRSPGTAPAGR